MREQLSEEWRPVVGWEDIYSVSNLGEVRQEARRSGTRPGRILKPYAGLRGYHYVTLYDHGPKTATIHTLVATAFLGPRPPGLEVNHKDGVKLNNAVGNLEYCTRSENQLHAFRLGLHKSRRGEMNPRAKLTEGDVLAIRAATENGAQLARRFGVTNVTISRIRRRKAWTHVP